MSFMPIDEAKRKIRELNPELERFKSNISEANRAFTMYVALSRRAGLPPEIMDLIAKAQQARISVDMLTRSIQYFYATSGPVGWLLGLGGLALSAFMVADIMEIQRPQY